MESMLSSRKIRDERRRERRFPYNQTIVVDKNQVFRSIDISEGGLYLYTRLPYMQGTVVSVTLPFKNRDLTVKARVRHNQRGVGMGLMFINLLPAQKAMIRELVMELAERAREIVREKKKVLLADKNEVARRIFRNKLLMDGFSVIEAKDGMETLKLVRDESPNLVVLDLHMEKIDGFKVLSILKTSPDWENLPVIIWSAQCSPEVVDKAIQIGADRFLHKSVTSPIQLTQAIEVVLSGTNGNNGKGGHGPRFG